MENTRHMIDAMLGDPRHGWSIGTFGAIAEFMRDDDEETQVVREGETISVVTPRAGIRVRPVDGLKPIAFDTLSSDGETWGQSILFCLPQPEEMDHNGVIWLGKDSHALREQDREADLFDLGAGRGHVRFCVRTRDQGLIDALKAIEGNDLFGPEGVAVGSEVLRAQPHRVALSPAGRIEVYAPIPLPGGTSPEGPHTHLLPKMVASGKTHASNSPVPKGLQPVLSLHPRSPWRDAMGQRVPFDTALDELFDALLSKFGLPEDITVRRSVEEAVAANIDPSDFAWPNTRRGRASARIALRRLARTQPERVAPWRQLHDGLPEPETEEAEAVHA